MVLQCSVIGTLRYVPQAVPHIETLRPRLMEIDAGSSSSFASPASSSTLLGDRIVPPDRQDAAVWQPAAASISRAHGEPYRGEYRQACDTDCDPGNRDDAPEGDIVKDRVQRCRRTDTIIENRLVRNDTRGVIDRGGLLYDSYQASLTHCRGRENSKRLLLLAQVGKERDCNREA